MNRELLSATAVSLTILVGIIVLLSEPKRSEPTIIDRKSALPSSTTRQPATPQEIMAETTTSETASSATPQPLEPPLPDYLRHPPESLKTTTLRIWQLLSVSERAAILADLEPGTPLVVLVRTQDDYRTVSGSYLRYRFGKLQVRTLVHSNGHLILRPEAIPLPAIAAVQIGFFTNSQPEPPE